MYLEPRLQKDGLQQPPNVLVVLDHDRHPTFLHRILPSSLLVRNSLAATTGVVGHT